MFRCPASCADRFAWRIVRTRITYALNKHTVGAGRFRQRFSMDARATTRFILRIINPGALMPLMNFYALTGWRGLLAETSTQDLPSERSASLNRASCSQLRACP